MTLQKYPLIRRSLVWFIISALLALITPYLFASEDQSTPALVASPPSALGNTYIIEREITYTTYSFNTAVSDIVHDRLYVGYDNSIVAYNTDTGAVIGTIPNV